MAQELREFLSDVHGIDLGTVTDEDLGAVLDGAEVRPEARKAAQAVRKALRRARVSA